MATSGNMESRDVDYVKTHEVPTCRTCGMKSRNTIDGQCEDCHRAIGSLKETGIKQNVSYDRLGWYAYILKRAITNREPLTAWDAAVCITSHFDNVYGRSQERDDERHIDSFERKK